MRSRALPGLLGACLLLCAAACGRSDEPTLESSQATALVSQGFRVTAIDLGSALGPDKRLATPTTIFAPTDTFYATVASEGSAPQVTLTARWTYENGQLVTEQTEKLSPAGPPVVTEFHLAKPSGWPAGRYRVELAADQEPIGALDFEVR